MNKEVFIVTVNEIDMNKKTIAVCESFDKAMNILKGDKENRVFFTPTYENKVDLEDTWIRSYFLITESRDDILDFTYTITRWEVM